MRFHLPTIPRVALSSSDLLSILRRSEIAGAGYRSLTEPIRADGRIRGGLIGGATGRIHPLQKARYCVLAARLTGCAIPAAWAPPQGVPVCRAENGDAVPWRPRLRSLPLLCDALLDRLLFLVQDTAAGRVPIAQQLAGVLRFALSRGSNLFCLRCHVLFRWNRGAPGARCRNSRRRHCREHYAFPKFPLESDVRLMLGAGKRQEYL
jgi:hypothetical protein